MVFNSVHVGGQEGAGILHSVHWFHLSIHSVTVPPSTRYMTAPWNTLLQDIVENKYLRGSNKASDNEKLLIVKYNGLAKGPSLDMSAVLAVRD